MKYLKWFFAILVLLLLAFGLGPRPDTPQFEAEIPQIDVPNHQLASFIRAIESHNKQIKPDNQARVVWADTNYAKTPYSLLYLHGFSACQEEGAAMARSISRTYGMNLFLARLHKHGLEGEDAMLNLRADSLYFTALAALGMAQNIGEKVIIMSTSTGGTLALALAAKHPDKVDGLICYSPNIQLFDGSSAVMQWPWGLSLAKLATGNEYHEWEADEYTQKYWTSKYPMEALEQLVVLMEHSMTPETFAAVKSPVFLAYYYKDESHQDQVVSVPAMLEMFEQLGTEASKKRKMAFPEAGDHVLANPQKSNSYEEIQQETGKFLEEVLGFVPKSAISLN